MKTTQFDRLITSKPINKEAGVVVSTGIHWTPDYKPSPNARRWDAPPIGARPPRGAKSFVDLTGTTLGRFTVVRYLGKINAKKKAVWLVRCTCGAFETRGARAIREQNNPAGEMCLDCKYLDRVRRRDKSCS